MGWIERKWIWCLPTERLLVTLPDIIGNAQHQQESIVFLNLNLEYVPDIIGILDIIGITQHQQESVFSSKI